MAGQEVRSTPARRSMLRRIFQSLDADHDGELSGAELEQLRRQFSGAGDNRAQSGEITETLAFRELLTELLGGDQNIMYEEWESYYTVKLAHLDDDAFCTRLSRTWGGKGSGGFAFVPQKRLDALEEVLLVSLSSQGSEREVLTRVFKKYDSNQDNMLQLDEFERFCEAFGLKASKDELKALFERYDADDSGSLVFREFSRAMLARTEVHRPK